MARRDGLLVAGTAGAVVAFAWLYGKAANTSIGDDPLSAGQAWDPYSHFLHQSPVGWVRHYPSRIAPTCLPMAYQNEDVGLSVGKVVTEDYAARCCAQ